LLFYYNPFRLNINKIGSDIFHNWTEKKEEGRIKTEIMKKSLL